MEIRLKQLVNSKALWLFLLVMSIQSAWAINQCQDVFPNGIQSFDTKGDIHFHYNAQLLNASSNNLKAKKVHVNPPSTLLSCGTVHCSESTPPTKPLTLAVFEKSNSTVDVNIPWATVGTLGQAGQVNYRNVVVSTLATLNVTASASSYHIKNLTVDYQAVLNLPAGDYWVENLTLNADSRIEAIGAGSVRLYVNKQVNIPWSTTFNNATQNASKFIFVAYADVRFDSSSRVYGFVYSAKRIDMDYRAEVHGAIAADKIMLKTEARVIFQPQSLGSANFGSLCQSSQTPPDTTPPILTLNEVPATTSNNTITITGTVSDPVQPGSGIASVKIITSGGTQLFATVTGNQYSATIPLVLGDNLITVEARDLSDNLSTRSVTVNRFEINPDTDGDGYPDTEDRFPNDPTEWADLDNDGIGDNADTDRDGDGFSNDVETQVGTNPNDPTSKPSDVDGDGIPDSIDPDRDGDGVNNELDKFPDDATESSDLDNDGIGDNADTDRDGDGFSNDVETQVGTNPNDANSKPADRDGDGIPDSIDPDRDGDGVNNELDKFPDDATESSDLDNDGIGDNVDTDRDGDGFTNDVETQRGTNPNDVNDYPDTIAPLIQVINPANQSVQTNSIALTGSVTDPVQPYSGIETLRITSNRFANLSLAAVIDGANFTAQVPLALGVNNLTLTATDKSGNQTQYVHQVTRIDAPQILQITPANNSVITTPNITIAGQVKSGYALESLRFYINEWQVTPTETNTADVFVFSAPDIALRLGENTFVIRIESPDGVAQESLVITHTLDNPDAIAAPVVALITPNNNAQLRDASFVLKGRVQSAVGTVRVSVNGQAASVSASGGDTYYFETLLSFAANQTTLPVIIIATDALNKSTQLNAQFSLDNQGPQILLLGQQVAPTINYVNQSPVTLKGLVSDTNLTSVTLNDQSLRLTPGAAVGQYSFDLPLTLTPGQQLPVALSAYDASGNSTRVSYIFQSTAETTLDILLPGANSELIVKDEPLTVQVAARLSAVPDGSQVQVVLGNATTPLSLAGTLASGNVNLPALAEGATTAEFSLTFQVVNNNRIIASASRNIRVRSEAAIPLTLVSHQPENGAVNVEPNQPLELQFNKAIDPSKLVIQLQETLHGNTYVNLDAAGLNFLDAQGYQLQEVHRDNETLLGSLSVLPGNTMVGFYPARQFGFHADLIATVSYDNQELTRFTFKIRPLPTFIMGGVADQFGQPLPGVEVSLPDLNRTTTTNNDGGFAFGFQEPAGEEIPGGRHRIIINPDLKNPRYGVNLRRLNVQEGRKNEIGLVRLSELNPNAQFQLISSGQAATSFLGDDLKLNVSNARLLFSNNNGASRTSGSVQFQFMPFEQLGAALTPGLWPQWMFTAQPRGIRVEGTVDIDLKMPMRNSSYDYTPPGFEYVVLLGYDSEREVIAPVSIGRIDRSNPQNYRVKSIKPIALTSLDYLGYAWIQPEYQTLLKDVAEGRKTLQQMISEVQVETEN